MAVTDYTKEQADAIVAGKCDLLVSAAAGSGKTAVLVERIIKMVTDTQKPVDIDRLLVVTFTEAAAAEMRQRIHKAVTAEIKKSPENARLKKQLMLLNDASIMTLHSFCLSVIRKYFYEINIDPAFRVADVTETDLLKRDVLRELFGDCYDRDNNYGFTRLVEFYGNSVKDDALQELVLDIYEFVQSDPEPEEWLLKQAESFNFNNEVAYYSSGIYRYFVYDTQAVLEAALESMDKAVELCRNPNIHEKYAEALETDRDKIILALRALKNGLPAFYHAVNFDFEKLSGVKSKTMDGLMTDEEIKELKEEIKSYRNNAKDEIIKIREKALIKPPDLLLQDIRNSYPVIKELCDVVIEFSNRFSQAKRAKNIADFNDFEHLCLKAMKNESIAEEIRQKYEEVLIDEYQDINLVQETILETVSRRRKNTPNRFMVGDIKQSIYRFRMANPDLFRKKYNAYSKDGEASERRISLSKNFRSRSIVLDGINYLFGKMMNEKLGEVEYNDDARLYFGADYYNEDREENKTEVCVIDISSDISDAEDEAEDTDHDSQELIQDLTKYEIEAKIVAARIKELAGSFEVSNKNGGTRKAIYSDIVILLRSQKLVADIYARELKNCDIPAFADSSGGYFETLEIMTVLSFLKVIDNPRQDIPLISVMYSPLFSFTADELVEIRQNGGGKIFYDCVVGYADDCGSRGEQCSPVYGKLTRFLAELNKWRDMAVYTEISGLLRAIYEETGYYNYVGVLMGGNIRQANLRALFERAVQYEKTSLKGLFNFVKYIEKLQKSGAELGDAKVMGENENLVRIMSIHKSKGLEFPIVFVCGLGKRFNLQDAQKGFLMHRDLGFGSFYLDLDKRIRSNTLNRYVIGRAVKNESLSEEMRVLYVALTRAKEKLVLVGSTSKYGSAAPVSAANMTTYLDWILSALRDAPDDSIFDIYIKTRREVEAFESKAAGRYVDLVEKLEQIDLNKDYSGMKEKIYKRLSYVYPNLKAAEVPSKMSVSEIKRMNYQEFLRDSETLDNVRESASFPVQSFAKPRFIMGGTSLSQAEIGVIFHTVLEHMDFKTLKTESDIQNFLVELESKKVLTQEQIKYVNIKSIYKFLNSGIAERMKNAVNIWREAHFTVGITPSEISGNWAGITNDEIIVHGIIDCFFEEGDGIILVDYKTDNFKTGDIDEVSEKYRLQLELYKKAVEKYTGKKVVQSILYFFGKNLEKVL